MNRNRHQNRDRSTMTHPMRDIQATKCVRFSTVNLCLAVFICGCVAVFAAPKLSAQDWFKTGTGLGVSKARVGVADFAAKDTPSQPLAVLFSDVVRTDLDFCGILDLVS